MGICSKAKDIIYANNISDIQVDNKEKINNNNENNNNNNNNEEKNENNHSLKETAQKTIEEKPEEIKNQLNKENEKEKKKPKLKFQQHFSVKKVGLISDIDNNDKNISENERKRGKSVVNRDYASKFKRSSQKSATLFHKNNNLFLEKNAWSRNENTSYTRNFNYTKIWRPR